MKIADEVDAVSDGDEQFRIGLRVLVVDDDLCCLKAMESILTQCRFNVTTTVDPMEALKMLREDKNRFEILMTDITMPEIDGFKLLELIKLEMDIPVILFSALHEMKYVMKGIQLGACDYLVKPCRIWELRNIWLHVPSRRNMSKKFEKKKSRNQDDDEQALSQPETPKNLDDSIVVSKKKIRNEREGEENEEIEAKDRATTHKKPRVVWSSELHNKFLAAIEILSLEKAVPKKILDLMNVEGLTRENVASHLQKYRMYLKRIEAAQQKQENMRSMEGIQLPESQNFQAIPFSSSQPSEILGRFSSPSGLNMNRIASTGLTEQSTSQNTNMSFGLCPQNQWPELYQRNMRPLEINPINNLYRTRLPNDRVALTSSMNSRPKIIANPLLMQQYVLGAFGSIPLKLEKFDQFCQGVHLPNSSSTGFGPLEPHYHEQKPLNNLRMSHANSMMGQLSMNAGTYPHPNSNCAQNPNGEEHQSFTGQNPNHCTVNPPPLHVDHMVHDNNASYEQHKDVDKTMDELGIDFSSEYFLNTGEDEFLECDGQEVNHGTTQME